jgi:hypothetical protein
MAKDTFYFSHDFNSRNDIKIKKLIAKHGYLGYGLFWAIVEELYNNTNVLPNDYECIAFDLRTDANVIKSIVNDFDLFVIDTNTFGSLSIERRLNERNEKSKKARESVLKRWNEIKKDTNVLQTYNDSNTIKERKGKESKVNKNKEKIYRSFVHLSITNEEIEKLKIDYDLKTIDSVLDSIENYKDNKKYKSLYLTAKKWLEKEPKKKSSNEKTMVY